MNDTEQTPNQDRREIEFNVTGMTCHGCEQALSMLLRQHEAVEAVTADAKSGKVFVTLNCEVDQAELVARIHSAGFDVR